MGAATGVPAAAFVVANPSPASGRRQARLGDPLHKASHQELDSYGKFSYSDAMVPLSRSPPHRLLHREIAGVLPKQPICPKHGRDPLSPLHTPPDRTPALPGGVDLSANGIKDLGPVLARLRAAITCTGQHARLPVSTPGEGGGLLPGATDA